MLIARCSEKREDIPSSMLPFVDLASQEKRLGSSIEKAIHRVLEHGMYILGPEVYQLEEALKPWTQTSYAFSCSNGSDALILALMAHNLQPDEVVFVPTFTFSATAGSVALLKGIPFFVDVCPDTYAMEPTSLKKAIHQAKKQGLKMRGVIVVDLFGQPADYESLQAIADQEGLFVISDAAQSFGATWKGRPAASYASITTTSFYPAKPLGCYGEGGAVFTQDEKLAQHIKMIRVHGEGDERYTTERIGMNGRLETLQAAILLQKLTIFGEELQKRQEVAARYTEGLASCPVKTPLIHKEATSSWAVYTIQVDSQHRQALQHYLQQKKIPTMVYYPKPLHLQPAFQAYPRMAERLVASEEIAHRVLSLPLHPYLEEETQIYIIETLQNFLRSGGHE